MSGPIRDPCRLPGSGVGRGGRSGCRSYSGGWTHGRNDVPREITSAVFPPLIPIVPTPHSKRAAVALPSVRNLLQSGCRTERIRGIVCAHLTSPPLLCGARIGANAYPQSPDDGDGSPDGGVIYFPTALQDASRGPLTGSAYGNRTVPIMVRHMGRSGVLGGARRAGDRTLQLSLVAASDIIQVDAEIAPGLLDQVPMALQQANARCEELRRLAATGEPVRELAAAFGIGRATAYRYLAGEISHRFLPRRLGRFGL
jgi:hypothetical protein